MDIIKISMMSNVQIDSRCRYQRSGNRWWWYHQVFLPIRKI